MPQPLPSTLPESLISSSEICLAYPKIWRLEQASHTDFNPDIREKKLICARILGYLILEGPSTHAKEYVAQMVNRCRDDDEVEELGEDYFLQYLRACE
jgi:hypothetical protein